MRNFPVVRVTLACVLASAAPVQAQQCFRPRPAAQCSSFLLTEFAIGMKISNGPAGRDVYYSGEFGWMTNASGRSAIGGGVQFGVDDESDYRIGVKPRYRHWLGATTSMDVAAGLLVAGDGGQFPGFTGHGSLNFAKFFGVGAQVEAFEDAFGETQTDWYVMGRVGGEAGLVAGLLAAVVGLVVAAASGVTS